VLPGYHHIIIASNAFSLVRT